MFQVQIHDDIVLSFCYIWIVQITSDLNLD